MWMYTHQKEKSTYETDYSKLAFKQILSQHLSKCWKRLRGKSYSIITTEFLKKVFSFTGFNIFIIKNKLRSALFSLHSCI